MSPSTFNDIGNEESEAELKIVARASRICFRHYQKMPKRASVYRAEEAYAPAIDALRAASSRLARVLRVRRRTITITRAVNYESRHSGKKVRGKRYG